MFTLWTSLLATVAVYAMVGSSLAEEPLSLEDRKKAWSERLEEREFRFPKVPKEYNGILHSLMFLESKNILKMIYDPGHPGRMGFEFECGSENKVEIQGHLHSAFTTSGDALYFAKYGTTATGCTVVAYDLTSGKECWRTALHHEQPRGHSGYANFVKLGLSRGGEIEGGLPGAAVIITGRESYCDYVEVLDSKTGETLALKNYRVGY